ncbi:MAG: hypothetical protein KKG88_10430 [Proteobacteria bacterium]|nr:hypothetical protein [Pseudomonadota bacterium]
MTINDQTRDATATILGYIYQFDATILTLCASSNSAIVDIEAIEDFDISTSDFTELFQCKYYEATRLTPATIRDAILPMLKGFLRLNTTERSRRWFHLYGFFKDSTPGDSTLTLNQLKGALTRRGTVIKGKETTYIKVDLQKELNATDEELSSFVSQLSIKVTVKADEHRRQTIEALRHICKVSHAEAELYVYPTARTLISTIACSPNLSDRRLTREKFVAQISPSRALFNQWSLREHGEKAYCIRIRKEYFTERNVDPTHRVFIIDGSLQGTDSDLLSLCHTLRKKWSSHAVRRKPDSERYIPTLFVRDMSEARIVTLKTSLHNDDVRFVDGYPFLGASFSPEHLCTPQTFTNQISLRIISSRDELSSVLKVLRGQCIIYDFYATAPTEPLHNGKWVSLPTTSLNSIDAII